MIKKLINLIFLAVFFLSVASQASKLTAEVGNDVRSQSTKFLSVPTIDLQSFPADILNEVFTHFHQQDIPLVSRVNKKLNAAMQNRRLWYHYAKRSNIVVDQVFNAQINYKLLIQKHCTCSFTDFDPLETSFPYFACIVDRGESARFLHNVELIWTGSIKEGLYPFTGMKVLTFGISMDRNVIIGKIINDKINTRKMLGIIENNLKNQPLSIIDIREPNLTTAHSINNKDDYFEIPPVITNFLIPAERIPEDIYPRNFIDNIPYAFLSPPETNMHCILIQDIKGYNFKVFMWTPETKMQSIEEILKNKNVLPQGWKIEDVNAVNPSGTVVVGYGKNADGIPRAWRAVIPRKNLF